MSHVSFLVHYGSIRTANTLTKVSEAAFQTLVECKNIRLRLGVKIVMMNNAVEFQNRLMEKSYIIAANVTKSSLMLKHC